MLNGRLYGVVQDVVFIKSCGLDITFREFEYEDKYDSTRPD